MSAQKSALVDRVNARSECSWRDLRDQLTATQVSWYEQVESRHQLTPELVEELFQSAVGDCESNRRYGVKAGTSTRRSARDKRVDQLREQILVGRAANKAAGVVYELPGPEVFRDLARIMGPGLRKIHERRQSEASA